MSALRRGVVPPGEVRLSPDAVLAWTADGALVALRDPCAECARFRDVGSFHMYGVPF